ncbi:hypothetical protein MKW98_027664 [Papaver atlanticum]|uniref:Uncharacterized protein n=1 Tax=Papaver atlanticum TaxID=357466 RepID=A0AAD4SU05_9MAGN|nr:hypothetical protein MKW98_027664 [Papaver atlanticum]
MHAKLRNKDAIKQPCSEGSHHCDFFKEGWKRLTGRMDLFLEYKLICCYCLWLWKLNLAFNMLISRFLLNLRALENQSLEEDKDVSLVLHQRQG